MKKVEKKLNLKKEIISNLNELELITVSGGLSFDTNSHLGTVAGCANIETIYACADKTATGKEGTGMCISYLDCGMPLR